MRTKTTQPKLGGWDGSVTPVTRAVNGATWRMARQEHEKADVTRDAAWRAERTKESAYTSLVRGRPSGSFAQYLWSRRKYFSFR